MAADIGSEIRNGGLPAPIDVQVVGHDPKNYQIADELRQRIAQMPGAVDVNVHQVIDNPSLLVNIDRTRADQLGLTEKQIADDLLISYAVFCLKKKRHLAESSRLLHRSGRRDASLSTGTEPPP